MTSRRAEASEAISVSRHAAAGKSFLTPKARRHTKAFGGHGVLMAALFLAPALLLYFTFTIAPLVSVFGFSMIEWTGSKAIGFVGFDNFISLLEDGPIRDQLLNAFRNNVAFFVGTMLIQNTLGLLMAVLLNRQIRARRFFQTSIALPFLVNPLVVGYVWLLLLSPLYGPFAEFLRAIGQDDLVRPWLGDPTLAGPIVVLINAWQWIGFPMLLFSAALAGIPEELNAAARVDGATRWQTFRHVTLPLLAPAFGTITILTFIGSFNAFNLQFAIGGVNGGPAGSTDVLGLLFYRLAFGAGLNSTGVSSALAVLTFIFVFGCALLIRNFLRRIEERLS